MRNFAAAALLGVLASAEFSSIEIFEGTVSTTKYYVTAENEPSTDSGVLIPVDNIVTLRNSQSTDISEMYRPDLLGGAIEYNVDLSTVGCGCVAGLYAVTANNEHNSDVSTADTPEIPTVDIM